MEGKSVHFKRAQRLCAKILCHDSQRRAVDGGRAVSGDGYIEGAFAG